ncbi:MAG: electron transfer flavoprotein subunit beta/FixA family protein [Magnetococcales bacterium]|nr:electron transfer flavoprotein subunit beta/FixA family protein [Magnetococcales bacterium]
MNILVPVKTVPDPASPVRIKADGSGVDLDGVKEIINPFDEIALEAGIRLKEAGVARQVEAISVGPEGWLDGLRTALALGADRGILVEAPGGLEPLLVAHALAARVRQSPVDLILTGRQSVDGDHNQVGQLLAGLLGWGQATFASSIEITNHEAVVTREVDGGLEQVAVTLPAVITVDLRLNEPRYPSLPNIMKARKKPLERIPLAELGINATPRLKTLEIHPPPPRKPGVRVGSVRELAEQLKMIGVQGLMG